MFGRVSFVFEELEISPFRRSLLLLPLGLVFYPEGFAFSSQTRLPLPWNPGTCTGGRPLLCQPCRTSIEMDWKGTLATGVFLPPVVRILATPSKRNPSLQGGRSFFHQRMQKDPPALSLVPNGRRRCCGTCSARECRRKASRNGTWRRDMTHDAQTPTDVPWVSMGFLGFGSHGFLVVFFVSHCFTRFLGFSLVFNLVAGLWCASKAPVDLSRSLTKGCPFRKLVGQGVSLFFWVACP